MDIAVAKLEALIKQAEMSLDNMVLDLEMQYSKEFGCQFTPATIIQSTQELTDEFEGLKNDADALVSKQQAMKNKIDKELTSLCKKTLELQKKVGVNPGAENATYTILKTCNAVLKSNGTFKTEASGDEETPITEDIFNKE